MASLETEKAASLSRGLFAIEEQDADPAHRLGLATAGADAPARRCAA
jgi:hypothetical protein